jgi:predicted RNase H-like nuclease
MPVTFVGFDSAWTDNPTSPGAICSVDYDDKCFSGFKEPALVRFSQALDFVHEIHGPGQLTLVAIDQPTIVPNQSSMRPAERIAASAISWLGGGVQPANRARVGMFDDEAPIWSFLRDLGATEDPERGRSADVGLYVMEVFPALALPAFHEDFCGRLRAPRYNPARRTFRKEDWVRVVQVVAAESEKLGCLFIAKWCASLRAIENPRKSDQDKLDAVICLLIAIRWRLSPREQSVMIGDMAQGYIIAPVVGQIRDRLRARAALIRVALDGVVPGRTTAEPTGNFAQTSPKTAKSDPMRGLKRR